MFMDKVKKFCDHSMILWEIAGYLLTNGQNPPPMSFWVNVICPPKIKIVTWSLSIRSWHHRHVRRQENIPCVIFISSKVHNAQVTFSTSNRCCRSLLTQSYKSKVCSCYEILNWHQNYSLDFLYIDSRISSCMYKLHWKWLWCT